MARNRLLTIALLLLTFQTFAQKYGNIWQFGNNVGLDFNSCNPVVLSGGKNSGFEGCATICDTAGQVLFYTNSDSVWNRLNNRMPNGFLVSGSGSLSQVIIIPKPQSDSLYYVVTTKLQGSGTLSLQYHIVDMSLNNGLGDVTSKNNVLTTSNVTEQIAATYSSNGGDIWLMAHEYGTNNFLAYQVTAAGIYPFPAISSVGPVQVPCSSNMNARGEIKFSPDGTKLAFNGNGVGNNDSTNILSLFDFNNATGVVSNPLDLPYSRGDFGLSFSPDNSKLYGTTWKAFNFSTGNYNYIYQFDLSSGVPATIVNSKQIIDSIPTSGNVYGSLKIGPDARIYVAISNSHYVGVINNPNLAGSACNYVANGIFLGQQICKFGLNNYIEYQNYCHLTGIEDANNETPDFTIAPNPCISQATIRSKTDLKHAIIKIYSELGTCVKTINNVTGNTVVISRESLANGIYFIQISWDNQILFNQKILFTDH